jgi:hypothetical protein
MNGRRTAVTPSAYVYPLLIKQLLDTPLAQAAHQEIVYRDVRRLTYLQLRDRIGRLASALQKIGVRPGDSVGVLDWDSNRFLEAFFAIPLRGSRKVSTTATANWCFMRWRNWPCSVLRRSKAASIAMTSICRSRRCSMFTHGASLGRRRLQASSRSTPAELILLSAAGVKI